MMLRLDLNMEICNYAVVVLSYNHPDLTSRCLQSLFKISNNLNIYLIHNGSNVKNKDRLKSEFPFIHHHEIEINIGYSGGANEGLKLAFQKFDTCLFLTNDTEVLQLPELIPQRFSSVKCLRRNTDHIDSVMGMIDLKKIKLKHLRTWNLNQNNIYIPGSAFWLNRDLFNQLNGFDESFHTYWEDVDFSHRARQNGHDLFYSEQTVIKHKIGKTCHKDDFYTFYLFQRNRKRFAQKHQLTDFLFWCRFYFETLWHSKWRLNKLLGIWND